MSTTSWNSLLLSKGSILSTTPRAVPGSAAIAIDSPKAPTMPAASIQRRLALSSSGISRRWNSHASFGPSPASWPTAAWAGFISRSANQGVTVKAIISDSAMPRLALIGIGLMYGPISPLTNAIGNSAAITVSVARMVGPPTSSTAVGMMLRSGSPGLSAWWRWMFSTTTIASSTRMPIEKISANSETRFSVKPQAQLANKVAVSVRITAAPTITASRRPNARPTSRITDAVAKASFWISLLAFSAAVWP